MNERRRYGRGRCWEGEFQPAAGAGQGGRPWGGGRGRCWGGGRGAGEGRGSSEAAPGGEARPPRLRDLLVSLDRRLKALEERRAQGPPVEP
jgi:hypothetical protein